MFEIRRRQKQKTLQIIIFLETLPLTGGPYPKFGQHPIELLCLYLFMPLYTHMYIYIYQCSFMFVVLPVCCFLILQLWCLDIYPIICWFYADYILLKGSFCTTIRFSETPPIFGKTIIAYPSWYIRILTHFTTHVYFITPFLLLSLQEIPIFFPQWHPINELHKPSKLVSSECIAHCYLMPSIFWHYTIAFFLHNNYPNKPNSGTLSYCAPLDGVKQKVQP